MTRKVRSLFVVVAGGLLLAACTSSGANTPSTTSTRVKTSTSTPSSTTSPPATMAPAKASTATTVPPKTTTATSPPARTNTGSVSSGTTPPAKGNSTPVTSATDSSAHQPARHQPSGYEPATDEPTDHHHSDHESGRWWGRNRVLTGSVGDRRRTRRRWTERRAATRSARARRSCRWLRRSVRGPSAVLVGSGCRRAPSPVGIRRPTGDGPAEPGAEPQDSGLSIPCRFSASPAEAKHSSQIHLPPRKRGRMRRSSANWCIVNFRSDWVHPHCWHGPCRRDVLRIAIGFSCIIATSRLGRCRKPSPTGVVVLRVLDIVSAWTTNCGVLAVHLRWSIGTCWLDEII